MLKRIAKAASLVVCFASVLSTMPAMAADIKEYEPQEGTIHYAKTLGTGGGDIIYIDGEINGSNDDAVYYMTSNGKYNKLDIDDGNTVSDVREGRYLPISDNETVIDTKNGFKIMNENTDSDLLADIGSIAKQTLRRDDKEGRFDSNEFKSIKSSYFVSAWGGVAPYSYNLAKPFKTNKAGTVKDTDRIYVDYKGQYVDADYNLGKLKVTTTGGSVTMKNTDDTYDITEGSTTYEYKAVLKDLWKQEDDFGDYLYRWASLSIYKKVKGADDLTYINVTNKVGFGSEGYNAFIPSGATSIVVLHKYSKPSALNDSVDGIKYPRESTLYFLANEDGDSEVMLGYPLTYGVATEEAADKLGITYNSNDKVKVKFNNKGYCSAYLSVNEKKVYAQSFKLKSKKGFNYIELGNDGTEDDYDIKCTDTSITDSICSSGGNIFVLDGGDIKIYGPNDEKFTKLYKVDSGMNHMSLNSKDFGILWNDEDGLYTIINNKNTTVAKDTTTKAVATTPILPTAVTSWEKAADGTWSYNGSDGKKVTGWFKDGSTWYYFNALGVMQSGWVNDNGNWYYCNVSGAMLFNTTVDGYALGANGAWIL